MELTCNRTIVTLVTMALTAALGVLLMFLGCALTFPGDRPAQDVNWWGIFVVLFYILSPIPLAISRKLSSEDYLSPESNSLVKEVSYFISACIVVGGFGLPIVLARRAVIQAGAAGLIGGANIFVFGTVYSYFVFFAKEDDSDWNGF
ncbi:Leptin receptor gene-related protein [Geodia barretti]|uniref:Leptin receptor gene-related protein n=1 Tax=Geodia barretti TaxID=519541 RepID=A0AA35RET9_GEOBA|nr:Leptin receptor gene-related protein [Geodia barretti]